VGRIANIGISAIGSKDFAARIHIGVTHISDLWIDILPTANIGVGRLWKCMTVWNADILLCAVLSLSSVREMQNLYSIVDRGD
jgi:hypothetical protein